MIRVMLADDHHVVRAAVASFLAKERDIEVVGEVAEAASLLDAVAQLTPHVLVLDAHMPGRNVIEVAQLLRESHPSLRILVLSAYDRREYVVGLLRAGASGYVLKDDSPETLVQAVQAVAEGREWLSPRVLRILMKSVRNHDEEPFAELTRREMEVLHLMANGCRNEEIAETLVISSNTVKNHVHNIFSKLGAETRVEAVLYALDNDLAAEMEGETRPASVRPF